MEDEDRSENDISSDESDDDSSEMSDVEISEEEINSLEEKVKQNPFNYEAHIALVSALRSLGDIEKVREARERMSSCFPLPEDQWLQWIDDEEGLARTPLQKEQVINYFERAVKDYQSVTLWERFGQFLESFLADTDAKRVREVYEDAITAVGLHVAQGGRIWSAYRGFEFRREETENVRKLFQRQLAIPLLGMDKIFQEYVSWEAEHGGQVPQFTERAYQAAVSQLEERKEYEDRITGEISPSNPDYTKLGDWNAYLHFEEEKGNPARVQCLYERALRGYCLVVDIWKAYIDYMERTLTNPNSSLHDVIISIYTRAVRNYPWSGDLWSSFIRALERAQHSQHEIRAFFEKSLQAGLVSGEDYLKVFDALIDYYYRIYKKAEGDSKEELQTIRNLFERAVKYLEETFPGTGLNERFLRHWAALELRQFSNAEKSVSMWEDLIKNHATEAEAWQEYILLVKSSPDSTEKCRTLYKRACNSVSDWPEKIWESWISFEREMGSLEDWELARKRIDAKAKQVAKMREREAERYNEGIAQAAREQEAAKHTEDRKKERSKNAKTKQRETSKAAKKPAAKPPSKKREREPPKETEKEKESVETSLKRRKVEETDETPQPEGEIKEKKPETTEPATPASIITDGSDPKERTVFVGNLSFATNENRIRSTFSTQFGPVVDVRLVRDKHGRSKGYCFLEFSNKESVTKAVDRKDLDIDGRIVGIQKENPEVPKDTPPPSDKKKRSYSDKNTVFVSNLSFSTTEEDLKQEFADCGNIKAIRLIRDQKQKSKGFSYIAFEDERSVQLALAHSQKVLKGRPLNVAISNPPEKKATETTVFSQLAKRPATILVPRIVKRAKVQLPTALAEMNTLQQQEQPADQGPEAQEKAPPQTDSMEGSAKPQPQVGKSNAYFKTLYAKKK